MRTNLVIFGYFSPEVMLPVTSIVATVAGIAMMLGRGSYRYLFRLIRRGTGRSSDVAATSRPHFHVREETPTEAARD